MKKNVAISVESDLTVVIVTRNRADLLEQAFFSLSNQTIAPKEILCVNNASTDRTNEVLKEWQQKSTTPFRIISEKKTNYPAVYNAGLRAAQTKFVAFLDDDCIADPNWIKEISIQLQKTPGIATVLGNTKTLQPQNIFSLSTYILDQNWKMNRVQGKTVLSFEILDNKNIVYNRTFFKKHHLQFDESRSNLLSGAAEDCDLGFAIEQAGGAAVYAENMNAVHQDPSNWSWFWKRQIKSFAAYLTLEKKWPNQLTAQPKKTVRLSKIIQLAATEAHYSEMQTMRLKLFLSSVVMVHLFLTRITSIPFFRNRFITYAAQL